MKAVPVCTFYLRLVCRDSTQTQTGRRRRECTRRVEGDGGDEGPHVLDDDLEVRARGEVLSKGGAEQALQQRVPRRVDMGPHALPAHTLLEVLGGQALVRPRVREHLPQYEAEGVGLRLVVVPAGQGHLGRHVPGQGSTGRAARGGRCQSRRARACSGSRVGVRVRVRVRGQGSGPWAGRRAPIVDEADVRGLDVAVEHTVALLMEGLAMQVA
eukprot:scaffold101244_cov63-Phaeocystis_antarctica.AAC.1